MTVKTKRKSSKNITKGKIKFLKRCVEACADESTCKRLKVGAILVKKGRIKSTGWNGVLPNKPHCVDINKDMSDEEHHAWSKNNELHAEMNCLLWAAREGIKTEGCSMLVSHSPCPTCALAIVAAGIVDVAFISEYDRSSEGVNILKSNKINIFKIGE